ncbi:hypothetical protein ACIBM4_26105 [Streptomyces sp. NPDC050256]|uniref:hypothetical protein n=1 Tax=Streptomyces sp. NPDC050256 TaxID=3365607 RepID=UPI00379584DB
MFAHLNLSNLTAAMLHGVACVVCAYEDGDMIPVGHFDGGHFDGGQLFAHEICTAQPVAGMPTVLVIGPVTSDDERADLTSLASDVTDQLGFPTIIGTTADVDVRNFAAVVVCGPALHDAESVIATPMILEAQAYADDVPVLHKMPYADSAPCDGCGMPLTIAAARDERGELFCMACTDDTLGCVQCGDDDRDTEPVFVKGAWLPLCSGGCASIAKALHPSPLNIPEDDEQPLMLGVVAA